MVIKGGDDPNGYAPSFVEKPRIIPNEAGTLITMKCRCKSKPAPVVTWYREKDVVQETSKIKIKSSSTEEDIYELVLEIKVKTNDTFLACDLYIQCSFKCYRIQAQRTVAHIVAM